MKRLLLATITVIALAAGQVANAVTIDLHNVTGNSQATSANLNFLGDSTFTFDDATTGAGAGRDFVINGVSGPGASGDAFGLYGNISGIFTIGDPSGGPFESATVTSSPGATLSIFDGVNTFSGLINWITLVREGTSGNLNISGAINLTGISYSGTVADLVALSASGAASSVINFTFNPALSINDLRTQNVKTSYSGDITAPVPDAGTTVMLLGLALSAVGLLKRKLAV